MSDSTTERQPTPAEMQQYGGQAVVEGVMMRSPRFFAVACRRPDGKIVVQREEVDKSILGKLKWMNKPFLRGSLALVDAMALGSRALRFAAQVQVDAEREANGELPKDIGKAEATATLASPVSGAGVVVDNEMPKSGKINDIAVGAALTISLVSAAVIFRAIPTLLTEVGSRTGLIGKGVGDHTLNAIDGLIRFAIFFGYIILISFIPQIRAVFQYHGAEHKAINTLEAGLPVTTENALGSSRIHPRCGTSFIFIVFLVDLIVCWLLPRPVWYFRILLHLSVVPPVAGLAYEVIKLAGKFRKNPVVMAIFAPGMWSQLLTTRDPIASQVEVAIAALHSVMDAEGHLPADIPSPDHLVANTA